MTNRFYNSTFNALPLTLIPSAAHNSQYAAVAAGFSALEAEIDAASAALVGSLAAKAPLASPVLTGTPTVPTASPATSTTQAASTAFVQTAIAAVNAQVATTLVINASAAFAVTSGQVAVATNPAAVAVTFPPDPAYGDVAGAIFDNGLTTNTVDLGAKGIYHNGASVSGVITNDTLTPLVLRWGGDYWRFI